MTTLLGFYAIASRSLSSFLAVCMTKKSIEVSREEILDTSPSTMSTPQLAKLSPETPLIHLRIQSEMLSEKQVIYFLRCSLYIWNTVLYVSPQTKPNFMGVRRHRHPLDLSNCQQKGSYNHVLAVTWLTMVVGSILIHRYQAVKNHT